MYPTIHDYSATNLQSQGYGALYDTIDCTVTEELNGAFTLELTYPLNGLHSEYLVTGNIIMAKPNHNQSRQPFRITEVKKSFANNIQVYANHICYDLSGYTIRNPYSYTSLAGVIDALNNFTWDYATTEYNHFAFDTDMTSSKGFSMPAIQTVRSWMGGQDGSILDVYGGEWAYDNFSCFLTSRRGKDTGYRISYGKNLAEYEKDRTYTEYSHVCAYWKKSDVVVYSDLISTGIDCAFRCGYIDATSSFSSQPTTAQLNSYASEQASSMAMGGATITVTPAQIGNDIIGIGDSVLICYETVFQTRVIKTVWDVFAGVYKTLQLGTRKANITDTIKSLSTAPSGTGGSSPITITVDDALSTTSTNPVQNRVITNALNNKVDEEAGKGLSTNDFTTAEKDKLAGIASGAEVNQNAFSNVKVGSTTIAADSETDTLELIAGNNITLTPNASGDSVTIDAVSGTAPADYIVESGTAAGGIWIYEKWNSGKAVAYTPAPYSIGSIATTNKYTNGWYWQSPAYNYPAGLFIAAPSPIVQIHGGRGLLTTNVYSNSASSYQVYVGNLASETVTGASLNVIAHGKWK